MNYLGFMNLIKEDKSVNVITDHCNNKIHIKRGDIIVSFDIVDFDINCSQEIPKHACKALLE